MYLRFKCNLLSHPTSLSLRVSAVYGHHQAHVYLAKIVILYVKIIYRV
jgi:hypothetical protein